jgi:predicted alpha/beta hydrolase
MEVINIQTEDGRLLTGNWIRATGALPVRGTVVIHSATGVPCKFYNAFAAYLSEQAFDVFLWDARGIGKSATVHARDDSATMRDWWHSPNSVDKYYCQNLKGKNVNAKSQIHS